MPAKSICDKCNKSMAVYSKRDEKPHSLWLCCKKSGSTRTLSDDTEPPEWCDKKLEHALAETEKNEASKVRL